MTWRAICAKAYLRELRRRLRRRQRRGITTGGSVSVFVIVTVRIRRVLVFGGGCGGGGGCRGDGGCGCITTADPLLGIAPLYHENFREVRRGGGGALLLLVSISNGLVVLVGLAGGVITAAVVVTAAVATASPVGIASMPTVN